MKTISSDTTFYKRVFPTLWLGGVGIGAIDAIVSDWGRGRWVFPVVPVFMFVFGLFLFKKLVWGLADEVCDGGDFLIVRRGGVEEHVQLSDIMNVSFSYGRPPRLVLRLRKPGKFGDEIAFSPIRAWTWNPFARNPVAEDLIQRVDRARSGTR